MSIELPLEASSTSVDPTPDTADAVKSSTYLTMAMIALTVGLFAVAGAFTGEKVAFLLKDELHLSAKAASTLGVILGVPAYLRPLFGAGSDIFPIFGLHRKPYYIISILLMALSNWILANMHSYHYYPVMVLILMGGIGSNLLMVMVDAVMVAVGNLSGSVGRMQAIQQGIPLVMSLLFVSHMRGYVTQHWSYEHCFNAAAIACLLGLPIAFLVKEPVRTNFSTERVIASLREAVRSSGLWVMVFYVFYLIVTPGTGTAQFYYSVNVLHFSKQFLGGLGVPGSAGAMAAVITFIFAARILPVRAMVWGAFMMDCCIYLVSMLLHDHNSAIIVTIVGSYLGTIYSLCLFTLAARACPPGIEGTVYGLIIASIGLGGSLGDLLGSSIFDFYGPDHHHSVTHGWIALLWWGFGLTVIAAAMIPFLPKWSRSNEPLHAGPDA